MLRPRLQDFRRQPLACCRACRNRDTRPVPLPADAAEPSGARAACAGAARSSSPDRTGLARSARPTRSAGPARSTTERRPAAPARSTIPARATGAARSTEPGAVPRNAPSGAPSPTRDAASPDRPEAEEASSSSTRRSNLASAATIAAACEGARTAALAPCAVRGTSRPGLGSSSSVISTVPSSSVRVVPLPAAAAARPGAGPAASSAARAAGTQASLPPETDRNKCDVRIAAGTSRTSHPRGRRPAISEPSAPARKPVAPASGGPSIALSEEDIQSPEPGASVCAHGSLEGPAGLGRGERMASSLRATGISGDRALGALPSPRDGIPRP